MPIYEFECPSCTERFDRLQKLSDPDPQDCPVCGASGVRRRMTAPAFRLAGSGWYETDFKKDGDKKRNLADKGGADKGGADKGGADKDGTNKGGAEKGDAAKADAKPAETAAAKTQAKPSESAAKPAKAEKPAPSAN
jgi:putative FmdB family regulatory protein